MKSVIQRSMGLLLWSWRRFRLALHSPRAPQRPTELAPSIPAPRVSECVRYPWADPPPARPALSRVARRHVHWRMSGASALATIGRATSCPHFKWAQSAASCSRR